MRGLVCRSVQTHICAVSFWEVRSNEILEQEKRGSRVSLEKDRNPWSILVELRSRYLNSRMVVKTTAIQHHLPAMETAHNAP